MRFLRVSSRGTGTYYPLPSGFGGGLLRVGRHQNRRLHLQVSRSNLLLVLPFTSLKLTATEPVPAMTATAFITSGRIRTGAASRWVSLVMMRSGATEISRSVEKLCDRWRVCARYAKPGSRKWGLFQHTGTSEGGEQVDWRAEPTASLTAFRKASKVRKVMLEGPPKPRRTIVPDASQRKSLSNHNQRRDRETWSFRAGKAISMQ